jgi:hypothetical protein
MKGTRFAFYLRSSRIEHGLLINFAAPKFEIRKYALSQLKTENAVL